MIKAVGIVFGHCLLERKDTISLRRFDRVGMCDDMMGSRFWVGRRWQYLDNVLCYICFKW